MFGIFAKSIKNLRKRKKSIAHVKSDEIINTRMKKLIRFVERYLRVKRDRLIYVEEKKNLISNYHEEIKDAKFNYNFVSRIYDNCLTSETLNIALKETNDYLELFKDYVEYMQKYEDPLIHELDDNLNEISNTHKEIIFGENNILTCYKIIDLIMECLKN